MQRIIMSDQNSETITLEDVSEHAPIFAKKEGELCGMIVNEDPKGWILRLGGRAGSSGHHKTLRECIKDGRETGYEFFT